MSHRHIAAGHRIAIFLAACLLVSLAINLCFPFLDASNHNSNAHSLPGLMQQHHPHAIPIHHSGLKETGDKVAVSTVYQAKKYEPPKHNQPNSATQPQKPASTTPRRLAGLSCAAHGGPSDEAAAEMVYWRDIPSDAHYTSPFYNPNEEEKFLLWDVDPAGLNNKRLSFENFVLLAHAMGRTLVMPAKGIWWGFSNMKNGTKFLVNKDKPRWSMENFYDIEQMAIEQDGFNIISMEDYLKRFAMQGKMQEKKTGKVLFPPGNKTNWNDEIQRRLKLYLEKVTTQIKWRPETCLGAFPSENTNQARNDLDQTVKKIIKNKVPTVMHWIGHPTPVNGTVHDRMEEMMTDRKGLCFYTPEQQSEKHLYYKILYDPHNHTLAFDINIRLLIYFYCWMFFQDWHQDLWSKRFIRDHLRYKDSLQCAAARIVHKLRTLSSDGDFDVLHIRRDGEFEEQYGHLPTGKDIVDSFLKDIPPSATVYIATDEHNRTFFAPLIEYFDKTPYFLNDFLDLIPDLDVNYYSLMDQLVATRGRKFFGAFCSTFTGYINRIRGYHSTKAKWKGYEDGALWDSFFYNYNAEGKRNKMHVYHPPVKFWFLREYPLAWRGIDHDLDESQFVD